MTYQQYRRSQIAELTPWTEDFDMSDVSISTVDVDNGSPKAGDMIARNPKNHDDKWLVAAQYFADNFEPAVEPKEEGDSSDRREDDITPLTNRVNITTITEDGGTNNVLRVTTTATIEEVLVAFKSAQTNDCRFFLQSSPDVKKGTTIVSMFPNAYANLELTVKPVTS